MNRAQRRSKKPVPMLEGFRFMLTPDEAVLMEEALYQYRVSIEEDHEGREMPEQSRWAHERAERLRRAMAAAIDGRPYRDVGAQRTAPAAV